jgi:Zn-dependent protease with chaperone function
LNFYERQAAARRQSRWLVFAFVAAVAMVVAALTLVVLVLLVGSEDVQALGPRAGLDPLRFAAANPDLAVSTALFWLLIIMGASVYRGLGLREGGAAVARSLGGTRVDRSTTDPELRRLRNVVEEMAIASGVPVPEVYVLDGEHAINAFAAGHSPANAAVAVTRGTLTKLTREELQGVVAHEFSHILNGDMALNIRMLGWLFGLMVIATMGRTVLRLAPQGRKGAAPAFVFGLVLLLLGYLGLGLGRVIQASVSRQRERLADASAVQFTRNPGGLKGALLKIAALPVAGRLATARADEVAHMLFVPGIASLLSTHPPLGERVAALDPSIRPERLAQVAAEYLRAWERGAAASGPAPGPAAAAAAARDGLGRLESLLLPAVAADVAGQVGNPDRVQIAVARELRLAMPPQFTGYAQTPSAALSLMLATLAPRDPSLRAAHRAVVVEALGGTIGDAMTAAIAVADELPPLLRLPAVCELFPALRRLPRAERVQVAGLISRLAAVDRDVDVFEFCLNRLVFNSLVDELQAREAHGNGALGTSFHALGVLLSVLAAHGVAPGSTDAGAARRAYDAGIAHVLPGPRQPEFVVPPDWPRRLWTALGQLEALHPFAKRRLVEALVATISHDGYLTVAEAELLRTTCAVLQCPLPPLLPAPAAAGSP